jgi:hypothetical protein
MRERERERERERVPKPVKSVVLKDNMDIEKFYEQQFLTTGIGALLMLVVKHHFQIQLRTSI